jgi:hypothetical protein
MDVDRDSSGNTKLLKKAGVIIYFHNRASFPISYIIDDLSSSLEGRINQNPIFTNKGAIVPPDSASVFFTSSIDLDVSPKTNMMGTLKFSLRYGRPNYERHTIKNNLNITWHFDPTFLTTTAAIQEMP